MVYLFAKTSKTFQTHFSLAATHQAPPLNRALIGCPRDSLKYPVRFHEFFFCRANVKNAGVRARRQLRWPLSGRRARAGPTGVCRVLGPWRTLDAPESPRVGCNCGLVALEQSFCSTSSFSSADWTLNTWSPLLISFSVCQEVSHCPQHHQTDCYYLVPDPTTTADYCTSQRTPTSQRAGLEQLSLQSRVISKTTSILFNTSRSASSRPESPSNPSDLREEAEYVLQNISVVVQSLSKYS